MREPKVANLGGKCSETELLIVARAVQIQGTTVSAFVRDAVLPVARDTIVKHAMQATAAGA